VALYHFEPPSATADGLCAEARPVYSGGTTGGFHVKPDLLTQLMGFLYSGAHYIGVALVGVIRSILPQAGNLDQVVDPVGFLAILTIFVVLTSVVKKVAVIVLIAGWVLILVRVVLIAFKL
jgi:hypothetical protein